MRRILSVKWLSPILLLAHTAEGKFGDAFDTVDVRLGASALAGSEAQANSVMSPPSVYAHDQAIAKVHGRQHTTEAFSNNDGTYIARQSCTTPSYYSDLVWQEPYSGAIFLSPGAINFEFTTTNIIQGDCIYLELYDDISGGFGTDLIVRLNCELTVQPNRCSDRRVHDLCRCQRRHQG